MNRRSETGFSLVEVTLAMGVLTFVLVGLVGLLATGLQTSKESSDDVTAAHLASALIAQRRAAPLSTATNITLPALNDPVKSPTNGVYRGSAYLTREGSSPTGASDRYFRMDYVLSRDASGRLASLHFSLITPWQSLPAEMPQPPGAVPMKTRFELVSFLAVPAS